MSEEKPTLDYRPPEADRGRGGLIAQVVFAAIGTAALVVGAVFAAILYALAHGEGSGRAIRRSPPF